MKYESLGARLYYTLGSAYYVFQWLLLAGGAGLGGSIFLSASRPALAAVIAILSLGILAAGIVSWIVRTKKRLDCINPDLLITSYTAHYAAVDVSSYSYTKIVTARARHSGVDCYRTKFRWTGTGDITIDVSPEFTIQREQGEGDTWDGARVFFRAPLQRGEEVTFAVTMRLLVRDGQPSAFLQKLIDDFYPNGLTMKVTTLETPLLVRREVFRGPRSVLALVKGESAPRAPDKEFSWFIRPVLIGRRYKLSWTNGQLSH